MEYQAITCVWEVTMGCNMRCKHCGSSCAEPLEEELSTSEALEVCRQIAEHMKLKWITLSGGEPLIRKDIHKIVGELSRRGVSVNIITNGWLLDEKMVKKLKENGISTVAISIDGTPEIHDEIRKKGSFEHAQNAFSLLQKYDITTGAITTISKKNIDILPTLKEKLISIGVETWQVQLGLPMGNFKERPEWVLEPIQVNDVIDFCYNTAKEGRIKIYPADCIGYYTKKEMEIKRISYNNQYIPMWDGCNAGVRSFGILHNGDILGCTSIRDKKYIEGNIRERSLLDIWKDKDSFIWRRNLKKEELSGKCGICNYASKCLGGCPNTRLTMTGDINGENEYCSYNLLLKSMNNKFSKETDILLLHDIALKTMKKGEYQKASYVFKRIIELESNNIEAYKAKAYCEYMCGNYQLCKKDNENALNIDNNDPYALKGLGIALYKMGIVDDGVKYLRTAYKMTGYKDVDILNDLRVIENELFKRVCNFSCV